MADKKSKKSKRSLVEIIVPVVIVAVFGLAWLTKSLEGFEYKVKDAFTWLVPEVKSDSKVVIVDIDDAAIQNVGMWPWSRDVHADILMQLKELGATYLTYDIEFVDRGPVGVTSRERDQTRAAQGEEMGQVFDALQAGQLPVADAKDAAATLLDEGIMLTARDNDELLGRAIRIFGKVFSTLNYDLDEGGGREEVKQAIQFVKEKSWLPHVAGEIPGKSVHALEKLRGAIMPVAINAAASGLTNVSYDKDIDGVLRRITLLNSLKIDDQGTQGIFGQLAFVPIWDKLGRPPIEVQGEYIILRTSTLSTNPQPNVVIPLDPNGKMIINWPHGSSALDHYIDGRGFVHVQISMVQNLYKQEQAIYEYVYDTLRANGYLQGNDFTGLYQEARSAYQDMLAQGDPAAFSVYREKHDAWLRSLNDFTYGGTEKAILDSLDQSAADPQLGEVERAQIPEIKASVNKNFASLRKELTDFTTVRTELAKRLNDAFCFIGWTSAATTDFGVTPFDPTYPMVGTHAAIANTIFTRSFQNELPSWFSYVIGAILGLGMILVSRQFKTIMAAIVGFVMFVVLLVVVGVVYWGTGTYIGALMPGMTLFVTVVAMTLIRFFSSEKDKAFLRNSFQSYLSPAVIEQIIADPDKLNLGGTKRHMTAMFTDVKGFSTFSEKLDPQDLVALLNRYLTVMSDIILESGGMIDKYEGDAIIANWGAIQDLDHAALAMKSAVLMKRAEAELNKQLIADGMVNTPLLTRIGINTGDMTVGNMGTAKRMDYTMMGNAVNLAARLEGVNKQYTTWILASQASKEAAGDGFLVRRLDRVRVVGISTPVRLYQVVDILAEADPQVKELIDTFEAGLDVFEERDWVKSEKLFLDVLKINPEDGPALKYLKRAQEYQKEAPAGDWDGVYSMTEK